MQITQIFSRKRNQADLADKKLGIAQARREFSDMVESTQHKGTAYVISRNGKPAAAVVPLRVYKRWKQEREALLSLIKKAQKNSSHIDPDEAMRLSLEAQLAVRKNLNP